MPRQSNVINCQDNVVSGKEFNLKYDGKKAYFKLVETNQGYPAVVVCNEEGGICSSGWILTIAPEGVIRHGSVSRYVEGLSLNESRHVEDKQFKRYLSLQQQAERR